MSIVHFPRIHSSDLPVVVAERLQCRTWDRRVVGSIRDRATVDNQYWISQETVFTGS